MSLDLKGQRRDIMMAYGQSQRNDKITTDCDKNRIRHILIYLQIGISMLRAVLALAAFKSLRGLQKRVVSLFHWHDLSFAVSLPCQ